MVPVDANVGRVLARAFAGARLRPAEAQRLADVVAVPSAGEEGGLAGLALMDLGATVCLARRPRCVACPLGAVGACAWRSSTADGEDPAEGSASVSRRQARFEGSDRQGRGRLLKAACDGPVAPSDAAAVAGWPGDPKRAERVAAALVAEGLLARQPDGRLALP